MQNDLLVLKYQNEVATPIVDVLWEFNSLQTQQLPLRALPGEKEHLKVPRLTNSLLRRYESAGHTTRPAN